jgi:hypothetical protein
VDCEVIGSLEECLLHQTLFTVHWTLQQGHYIYNRELGRVSVSFTRLSSQSTGHYNKDITYIIGSLEE